MAKNHTNDIFIGLLGEEFLVWHPDHVLKLRRDHRIIGLCVGSLPWKPRQNVQNSLPLRLSKIEAAFLTRRGIAKLRNANNFPKSAFSGERKDQIFRARERSRRAQKIILQEQKSEQLDTLSFAILQGKQAKKGRLDLQGKGCGHNTVLAAPEYFEKLKETELKKTDQIRDDQMWIKMEVSSKFADRLPLINDFDYDLNEVESLQLDVFSDLHEQGFYITNGNKFGGHFLVYPGDPVAYHSFYIAVCVPHRRKISGLEYSTYGRLASTVKKTLLLCSKTETGEINYLSMSWTGIVP